MKIDPCFFAPYLTIFMSSNWHCVITWWCPQHCIVNPIRINLVSWATFSHGVAMMVVTQTKDGLYYDWFPMDVFLPYNYNIFHICTLTSGHSFSLMCQHNMKNERHWKPSFFTFVQKLCVALQHVEVISILKHVVALGEGSSRLGLLSRSPPLSLFDMLFTRERGLGTWCSLCSLPS